MRWLGGLRASEMVGLPEFQEFQARADAERRELEKAWARAETMLDEVAGGKMPTAEDIAFLVTYQNSAHISFAMIRGMWASMDQQMAELRARLPEKP